MIDLKHKRLDVWKISIELTTDIYELTQSFPRNEQYGLTSQRRRAAVSISSNIAEGAARSSAKERRRFYEIARSSLVEIHTQLEIAMKFNCMVDFDEAKLADTLNHIFAMFSNMIKSYK